MAMTPNTSVPTRAWLKKLRSWKRRVLSPTERWQEERLRYPVATFREFNLFVNRMANRQASGEDKMPAELFKKASEIFRKQMMTIVNLILT